MLPPIRWTKHRFQSSCVCFPHPILPNWCPPRRACSSRSARRTSPPDIFRWNSKITHCFFAGDVESTGLYFHEMPRRDTVTWNAMISGYAQNYRIETAQRFFDAMPRDWRDERSWAALVNGYVRCGCLGKARRVFEKMPKKNVVVWNGIISGYVDSGRIRNARKLFDVMPFRDTISWAVMISGYVRYGLVDEARSLLDRAPVLGISHYNVLLSGYVRLRRHEEASELFAKMPQRDIVSWNTMITCYSRAGKMKLARRLFDEMPVKDTFSLCAIIRGYATNGEIDTARGLFYEMHDWDIYTCNTMLGLYVQKGMLEDALRLFWVMPKRDIVSWNSVLQGFVQRKDMINACCWFEKIPQRNETSWNILISGYHNEDALVLFSKMAQEGFKPDQWTLTIVISVCTSLAALGWGRIMHLHTIRYGFERSTVVMNSLITMYSNCGLIADSARVFDHTRYRDIITWTAMLIAHARNGLSTEALKLFTTMIKAGFQLNQPTISGLMSTIASRAPVDEERQCVEYMQD